MTGNLLLRETIEDDLPIFFAHQLDPDASHMAAFVSRDPSNREAFDAHWKRLLADEEIVRRTIVLDGSAIGHVFSYQTDGKLEVTYWIAKEHWGRGIATWALAEFLKHANKMRPIYARAAKDNVGSHRVLERCGFAVIGEDSGFANARGCEIEELILELSGDRAP